MKSHHSIYTLMITFALSTISSSCSRQSSEPGPPAESPKKIVLGPLTKIYSDNQRPYTMDGSWATLRNEDGTTTFFETAMGKSPYYFRHTGPVNNPLQTQLTHFNWDYNGYNHIYSSGCWIQNIYKQTKDTLIGLVHREDLAASNKNPYGRSYFTIGLARSFDGGNNWKYLGDVIGTKANSLPTQGGANPGGVPTLLVGDYMYLYYNETGVDGTKEVWVGTAVARARLSDVLTAIRHDQTCTFIKYKDGAWSENGMTGTGSCLLPDYKAGYDTHSDAAFCTELNKYMLTIQTHGENTLYLYLSDDGVHWGNRIILDYATGKMQPYSSIVSFNPDSRDDSFVVGSEFYIYIVRKSLTDYNNDEVYYCKITIEDADTK